MRLHHSPHDVGRICRRVSILLGCAALHAVQHVYLLFPQYEVRCTNRADSSTQHQRYHLLSAAALNSSRNRNFVHMKGELNGVSPVFARVSGFVASVARPRRSQVLAKELVAPGDGWHNRAAGGRWSGEAVPMTIETGRRSKTV